MYINNVKRAWNAYKKGNFKDALNLFNMAADKIGLHIYAMNIL